MAKTAAKRSSAADAKRAPPAKERKRKLVRPVLLAGGLGLIWFVQFQHGANDPDTPAWGYGLVLGVRLLADIVGAWVVISVAHLLFTLGRIAIARLFPGFEGEAS
jgi:hypothetical protein